jgi:hypothetical protein
MRINGGVITTEGKEIYINQDAFGGKFCPSQLPVKI